MGQVAAQDALSDFCQFVLVAMRIGLKRLA